MKHKLLLIAVEADSHDPQLANLQQVTLTLLELDAATQTYDIKENSFFVDDYTEKDFFDPLKDVPLVAPVYYTESASYVEVRKRLAKEKAVEVIQKALEFVDYIVGHNSEGYHVPLLKRLGVNFENKIIIDTTKHIDYPKSITTRKLSLVCAEHNFLLYGNGHIPRTCSINKAITTLLTKYSLEQIIRNARGIEEEKIFIIANISYDQKEEAKKVGFRYDPNLKKWYQRVTKERYAELLEEMGTQYLEIKE